MAIVPFSRELAQQFYESTEQFPINFDDAWQWLEYSRKDNAKNNFLKCGFVEGVDYFSAFLNAQGCLTDKRSSKDGKHLEVITMTCECFKQWGMMSGTPKGKEIRLYFLECERIAKQSLAKPQSTADMLLMYAQAFKEHEERLFTIEKENKMLKQQIETIDIETQANAAELERFKNGHGYWYSIAGWCKNHGYKYSLSEMGLYGRQASAMCRSRGIIPQSINDPRFGTVGAYPDSVLMEINWK
ncbi:MAG: hypothetical protein KatS3mg087_0600 [Patescibacteria group bacterium]|nr:MAG: hypothetical protein KatS3mg087_0600 [Patescibacteria group bacterium]